MRTERPAVGRKRRQSFLALAACALLVGCATQEGLPEPKPLVAVKTARAEAAMVELSLQAPATIFPREQANISARITAPIRELRAKKGDDVEAGEVLVVLESREARAALEEARANLERLSAGTLPTDIERARGQLETSQAALNLAQKNYDRRSELFRQGAIPQRDLLQSETELAQAKTNQEVAQRALDLLQQRSSEQDIAIARSRVEQASAQLEYTEIRSPFPGSVTEQLAYPGDMAKPDSPIFTVMDLSLAVARAQVPESQIAAVRAGLPCEFLAVDATIEPAAGKVSVINEAVDPQRRTVEVWCEIPNATHRLRAGAFGQVRIHTGTSNGVLVPQAAVQFAEGTRSGTVMIVDRENIAHQHEVETGETLEGKVQILRGLEPGERVIVEGGYGLPDGTEVTSQEGPE